MSSARVIEAVLANTDTVIGTIDWKGRPTEEAASRAVVGEMLWLGGLRVTGFARDLAQPGRPVMVDVHVDGDLVARVPADRWRETAHDALVPSGRIGFDVALPRGLADGVMHTLAVSVEGEDLDGSPTVMLVHEAGYAGLAGALDPQDRQGLHVRAQMLDRLMPGALPLSEAEAWLKRFPVDPPQPSSATLAVLIFGGDEEAAAATVRTVEKQGHSRWLALHVPDDPAAFAEARRAVVDSGADGVVVTGAGVALDPAALGHLAAALEHPGAPGLVYPDVVRTLEGRAFPLALPAYDRWRMRAQGYCADLYAVPMAVFERAAPAGRGTPYDVLLACLRACEEGNESVAHLPQLLATVPQRDVSAMAADLAAALAARGETPDAGADFGTGTLFPALHPVRRRPADAPGVSIVIPTRDRLDLLRPCIDSILARTRDVAFEIIVVDNGSREEATHVYLDALRAAGHVVIDADIPFNYSRLNNLAVKRASHPYVCLLNNDVEVLEDDWLTSMAALLDDAEVGVVGATLLWPSRIVQHGGVVMGPQLAARHAFTSCLDGEAGYGDMLLVERRHSAVTAACLLLRRDDYLVVGGLDEVAFPVTFNDVDLCLKVGALGKAIVMTPRARLLHKESASRGLDLTREKHARSRKEMAALRARWAEILADDPFYNPNLGLDLFPFDGLAAPPRRRRLRLGAAR